MNKLEINGVNEFLYYEKLDNGLEIYMIPKKDINNTYVSFATRYGSKTNEFIPLGEDKFVKVPNGIAHFLEHKLFEQKDGIEPSDFYAKNGADVNAFTSTDVTSYLFCGLGHLKENIEYLLDYVQSPYFTDENVEKEKGIIEQEIKMYDDDPYSVITDGILYNTFINNPLRIPVLGKIEDIRQITKETLYKCYNTFYHPSNMIITITGNVNPEEIVEVIKNNQSSKTFVEGKKIEIKDFIEPINVYKSYEEKEMNVEIPKLACGIKLNVKNINLEERKKLVYLYLLFVNTFGNTSILLKELREKGYVESQLFLNKEVTKDFVLYYFVCDTKKPKELQEEVTKALLNINISQEDFDRKIKNMISEYLYVFEDIHGCNYDLMNNVIKYKEFKTDIIPLYKSLKKEELDEIISNLDFSNVLSYLVKPFSI
ncbi:MAG: pitrilysin family protein [Bacilli bacterium]|nr:pitrilysin family protein [Bacilli bacterium]